jgi:hypothetical protein
MKKTATRTRTAAFFTATAAAVTLLAAGAALPGAARAQQQAAPPSGAAQKRVSLDVDGKNVKDVLLDLFRQAGVGDYTIAEDVSGPITLRLSDRPFEDALVIVARAARPPLTWNKADNVYAVKRRVANTLGGEETPSGSGGIPSDPPVLTASGERYEMLYPVYSDPQNLLRALELLQPAGLTAAFAYPPTNGLLVRFGGSGPLVTGVLGGGAPGLPAGGGAGTTGNGFGGIGNFGGSPQAGNTGFSGGMGNAGNGSGAAGGR